MTTKKRFDATVTGRVQGVGFRYFVHREASKLGLTGEVRNLADGGVRVIAEGDDSALKKLIQKLHEGPSFSHVQQVMVNWENCLDQYSGFDVTY